MTRSRRYVAVDGPPGAGVSALARALAAATDATLVADPAPANPFLDDYARDPRRYAFQAQVYCLLARYRQQLEIAQPDLFGPTGVVADYVFARDALFAEVSLAPGEFALYRKIHALLSPRLPRPDLVVYLTADREVLRARIRRSVAAADRVIKLNVMDQLAHAMDEFFFSYDQTPLLVINTSEFDVVEQPNQLEAFIEVIRKARTGVQHYRPIRGR
ncbi:MAG: deoxynucleoside kinase [Deltaproteobacteria bacterium]|nr:MAG: deoxynucleoside kinase [Deltaproteobacteria bacterium]